MISFAFFMLLAIVFARLAFLSVRFAWGFARVFLTLVFLPVILVVAMFMGLLKLSFPLLIVVGIISLFVK